MLALAYVDDRLFEANIDGGPVAWLHVEFVLEVRGDQAERAAEILKQYGYPPDLQRSHSKSTRVDSIDVSGCAVTPSEFP
jgi:hypothetical protein